VTKAFRLAVLGNPDGWYVRDLRRAASEDNSMSIDVVTFADLQVSTTSSKNSGGRAGISVLSRTNSVAQIPEFESCESLPSSEVSNSTLISTRPSQAQMDSSNLICLAGDDCELNFDGILVRTMPLGTLEQVIFRMNALHVAQELGVRVVNSPRTLEIAIDKWLTLDFMRRAGLDIPRTIVCQSREDALEAFESLGRDVVVKPLFGGEGRGIMRIDNTDLAWRVFSTLEQIGAVLYIQEFLPHHGYDLRLLLVGNQMYSVARHAPSGDWRTNLSRGGAAIPYKATESQINLAKEASAAIGGTIVGVDILPTKDGRDVLLEVNAVPGWRGTSKALNIDIACAVLEELRA
jgi:tetrahydromethanopterin:alpha-L-glutamate ligase